ncbi:hypothetical protein QSV34_06890 [Porticoccus sp. W117]|uniref:hypothetical protein n=1 Tax=Porticoccus sp. W117 TaxID=3054777 RepID=UPI002591DE0D|nr:hypothetical protein [Porticoccus sp. W117]MDM3871081.1 hypothetical protein [Porticoccus sp. W117]
MKDYELAQKLLLQREKGIRISDSLSAMKGKLTFRLIFSSIAVFLYWVSEAGLFLLALGCFIGATAQEIGLLKAIAKSWPFTEKIINWREVENISKDRS